MKFETYALGDVISNLIDNRGITPTKKGSDWSDSGYRVLSAKNVKTGKLINEDSIRFVSEDLYNKWMPTDVQQYDILITSEAPCGEILIWDSNEKIVLGQRLFGIRCKPEFDPRYVYYYLCGTKFQGELNNRNSGTTVQGIRQKELIKCTVQAPLYTEQKTIADILYGIDKKIQVNDQINRNLLDLANLMYDHTFPYSIEDDLPEGWRIGDLDEIIEIHDSKRVPLSGKQRSERAKIYPYYGAASVTDYVDDYLFDGVYLLLGEDGTVVTEKGNPVLQYVFGKFWVNNHAHILTGKSGFSVESLYLLCQRLNIDTIITGAVQPKISQSNLKTMQIVIPPLNVIQHYSEQIDVLFKQLRNNNSENAKLSSLRGYLLPKLMSGEIDVSKLEITN